MENRIYTIIAGSGSFIPEKVVANKDFLTRNFTIPMESSGNT